MCDYNLQHNNTQLLHLKQKSKLRVCTRIMPNSIPVEMRPEVKTYLSQWPGVLTVYVSSQTHFRSQLYFKTSDKFSHLWDVLCSINSAGTAVVQAHRGDLISSITPWPLLSPGSWEQTPGSLRRQPRRGQSLLNRDLLHTATPRNNAVCVCCVCRPYTNLQRNKLLPRRSSRPPCAGLLLGFVVLIEPRLAHVLWATALGPETGLPMNEEPCAGRETVRGVSGHQRTVNG